MPSATALYSVAEIRDIEHAAQAVLPAGTLMQRAGEAAAALALELIAKPAGASGAAEALILAGPGNNGGDALEVAARLAGAGIRVTVLLFADPARQSPESQQALQRARSSSARFLDMAQAPDIISARWSLIVDGLFGIGLTRPISGALRTLVEMINALPCRVLALDVPSGLDADTGNVVGDNGVALRADDTMTFLGNKPGLHTGHGRDYAGTVHVSLLQLGPEYFKPARAALNAPEMFAGSLRARRHGSHKGSYGDVVVVGGAPGMAGAAILAATAAAKSGAGRVFVAFIAEPPAYDPAQPELMCRAALEQDFTGATLVVGPGFGKSATAGDLLLRALHTQAPLVLDADALNLIAAEQELQQTLAQRAAKHLMTPHPLEAARLLGTSSAAIQANRLESARELARRFHATVILKGSGTVIARPDGMVLINTTGNPGLATAGTGDVLAGVCGAMLAQGWTDEDAALGAVWLHGHAADMLVEQGIGPVGLTAGELIPCVRTALNRLVYQHDPAARQIGQGAAKLVVTSGSSGT